MAIHDSLTPKQDDYRKIIQQGTIIFPHFGHLRSFIFIRFFYNSTST